MKGKILILFLACFLKIYSQKIEKKVGDIKIRKESFILKQKKGKSDYYFDKSGEILEKIQFGNHHSNKLNLIREVEKFSYIDNKLSYSKKYVSDCLNCSYYLYYSKFKYSDDNKLINEVIYRKESDSIFMSFNYVYKPNLTEIHSNSSTYIENKYNDENRIVEQSQIFEDTKKIRWKKEFVYALDIQVNKFQTYYGDRKENTEMEIIKYDSQKRIISKEIISEKNRTFLDYRYAQNGLIEKIYESESYNDKYELKYVTNFKIKKRKKYLDKLTVDKINSQLLYETSI